MLLNEMKDSLYADILHKVLNADIGSVIELNGIEIDYLKNSIFILDNLILEVRDILDIANLHFVFDNKKNLYLIMEVIN